jgi:hypothetical protein
LQWFALGLRHVGGAPFPVCRAPEHGVERWEVDTFVTRESEQMEGGHTRKEWCDRLLADLQSSNSPETVLTVVSDGERTVETCRPFHCLNIYIAAQSNCRVALYMLRAARRHAEGAISDAIAWIGVRLQHDRSGPRRSSYISWQTAVDGFGLPGLRTTRFRGTAPRQPSRAPRAKPAAFAACLSIAVIELERIWVSSALERGPAENGHRLVRHRVMHVEQRRSARLGSVNQLGSTLLIPARHFPCHRTSR